MTYLSKLWQTVLIPQTPESPMHPTESHRNNEVPSILLKKKQVSINPLNQNFKVVVSWISQGCKTGYLISKIITKHFRQHNSTLCKTKRKNTITQTTKWYRILMLLPNKKKIY